jgi:hypothetical protein
MESKTVSKKPWVAPNHAKIQKNNNTYNNIQKQNINYTKPTNNVQQSNRKLYCQKPPKVAVNFTVAFGASF